MNGVYEAWLEVAAERGDWNIRLRDYGGSVSGENFPPIEVSGMRDREEVAATLIDVLQRRDDLGLCGCLGARVVPSENGGLCGCTGCGEPEPSDRTASDYAVSIAAARSLK